MKIEFDPNYSKPSLTAIACVCVAWEALNKLESWKTWSRGAAVTAEGQLQCSFFTIFSARSAPPRDIAFPNALGFRYGDDREPFAVRAHRHARDVCKACGG